MASYPKRKFGNEEVSAIGFGAMGIAAFYGQTEPDEERFKVLDTVYESGVTFWDTADGYGDSEVLLGKWFKRTGKRNEIFLATKFGLASNTGKTVYGHPDYVPKALEKSLGRLGTDHIDLYYLHRPDPEVPIELTVGAMAEQVKAGKVKYLGLSECSANTLRRAYKVHPITAIQVEYSPFTLDIEDEQIGLLKTARELGVKIVAYSPLGRGFLTGQIRSRNDLDADDWRLGVERYSEKNFPNILKLADGLKAIGERHNATAGQVAIAWDLAQGDDIIPIPGTKKAKYAIENAEAVKVTLTPDELKEVRAIAAQADASNGSRYPDALQQVLFADTPELK
ncbi:hypothetical protein CCMSSC00406_0010247 [Pleurotus cornucopiae]|uniref:Uncharacterized protein n=1 Tax=Pleurotus cornucopiae TaxID=5321 RepID=A0ACB7IKH1_PLECO|nr:hypothetical protein CCMSSC00406_0010247 [Pleurotus cornucopiae]